MATVEKSSVIPPEVSARFEEALRQAVSGNRDPEAMKLACERMDRRREEIRRQYGNLNIGVTAIRELRGELPES